MVHAQRDACPALLDAKARAVAPSATGQMARSRWATGAAAASAASSAWRGLALGVQAKAKFSPAGDSKEREADAVADQVMGSAAPPAAKAGSGPAPAAATPATTHAESRGGEPLAPAQRAFFEPRFGHDFSQVRVHADGQAAHAAQALQARAYTVGRDIVFGAGQYAPGAPEGRRLLAHELAHVVQQARAPRAMIQRKPLDAPLPGSVVDQVMQALAVVSPVAGVGDFAAAFRVLDGLPVAELLGTLTELEQRLQLDLLISNAAAAAAFNQAQLVTAMQVVRLSHGPATNLPAAQAVIQASSLAPAVQQVMINYLLPLRPAVSSTRGADQRAATAPGGGAVMPNTDLARDLGYELDPSSRPPPAVAPVAPVGPAGPAAAPVLPPAPRIPWDGSDGAPGAAAARTLMQTQLFAAFDAYLTFMRPNTLAALARPRVPLSAPAAAAGAGVAAPAPTGVVDIANQARAVLERRYATSMDAAASSPAQLSDRSARLASGAGRNIFDASVAADRSTATNTPDLAPGVALWMFEFDVPGAAGAVGSRTFATDILAAHHYATGDPGAVPFKSTVANAYAAASTLAPSNTRQLIDYRLTGWSERGGRGIMLLSSFDPGANPNRAELAQRWSIFQTATHESLHLRTHPAFVAAAQGRGSLKEGFTEMFTVATLNPDVLPLARAGSLETLRHAVEGALSTPTPDATVITNHVTPTQYAEHRAGAERIRDGGTPTGGPAHVGVGEAAVRAAFFQGHVEYLGLAPAGAPLGGLAAAGATRPTRVPGGLAGLAALSHASGVPRAGIVRDNPGITDALPPAAVLAGCTEHWVVAGESRSLIAAQHGVSEADLVRANPDLSTDMRNAWPTLVTGQKLLIPVH